MSSDVINFAKRRQVPAAEIAQIERRAEEATRDYGGKDGEFAHSRLVFVLGRDLAQQFTEASAPAEQARRSA